MSTHSHLGLGARLGSGPARTLAASAFARELEAAPYLVRGLGIADMAHVLELMHAGIVEEARCMQVLRVLRGGYGEAPALGDLDPSLGDIYNNRDHALQAVLGREAGIIHTGRARREATTIAWQVACREALTEAGARVVRFAGALVEAASTHRCTYMPDFTYLHHAHPTTLGHYLLGFAYPVLRDAERLRRAYALVNRSPAGSGSVNGTRLPIDRERLALSLGFDGLVEHTRDAMWAPDMAIETMSAAVTAMTNMDRLAEELQLWSTEEFAYVELDDAHCRTSVIMPQKKNPYGLAFVRGQARDVLGRFVSVTASNLSPTGQPDNRIFAYEITPETLGWVARCAELMAETVERARFEREHMAAAARSGFGYSTDLCDLLVIEVGMDNRTAHSIVGRAVRDALAAGERTLELPRLTAAAEALGLPPPALSEQALRDLAAPEKLVEARQGRGAAGGAPMDRMLEELRATRDELGGYFAARERRFEADFLRRVDDFLAS